MRNYLRESELKILSILGRHRSGLTWSELLEKTGFSKSTLSSGLSHLKRMKLISKAIRERDEKVVYRTDIRRNSAEVLEMIEDFIDYTEFERVIKNKSWDDFEECIYELFYLFGAALITEIQMDAMTSKDAQIFARRIKNIHKRICGAISKILEKTLEMMARNGDAVYSLAKRDRTF